jgi:hypothetical protein
MRQMVRIANMRDENEVLSGIALGIITEEIIRRALGILETKIALNAAHKTKMGLLISTPDRQGILGYILKRLPDYDILRASLEVNHQPYGMSPGRITFLLRPKHAAAHQKTTFNPLYLKEQIDNYSPSNHTGNGGETAKIQFQINLIGTGNWNSLFKITEIIDKYRLNILHLSLPDNSNCKRNQAGKIVIEAVENDSFNRDQLRALREEIQAVLSEKESATILEIK